MPVRQRRVPAVGKAARNAVPFPRGNLAVWAIALWPKDLEHDPAATEKTRRIARQLRLRQRVLDRTRVVTPDGARYPDLVSRVADAVLDSVNARMSRKD